MSNIEAGTPPAKHNPTRRTIFGHLAGIGSAAIIVRAFANMPQPGPDARLLTLCAEANAVSHQAQNSQLPTDRDPPAERVRLGKVHFDLCTRHTELLEQAALIPARTPEGMRAKALAVKDWLAMMPGGDLPPWATGHDKLAWSFVQDVLSPQT